MQHCIDEHFVYLYLYTIFLLKWIIFLQYERSQVVFMGELRKNEIKWEKMWKNVKKVKKKKIKKRNDDKVGLYYISNVNSLLKHGWHGQCRWFFRNSWNKVNYVDYLKKIIKVLENLQIFLEILNFLKNLQIFLKTLNFLKFFNFFEHFLKFFNFFWTLWISLKKI